MKKLVLFFAVIVAVSFASCKKHVAPATLAATADTTVTTSTVDSAAVDTAAVDTTAKVAK